MHQLPPKYHETMIYHMFSLFFSKFQALGDVKLAAIKYNHSIKHKSTSKYVRCCYINIFHYTIQLKGAM